MVLGKLKVTPGLDQESQSHFLSKPVAMKACILFSIAAQCLATQPNIIFFLTDDQVC
jgi:hypothetical protein